MSTLPLYAGAEQIVGRLKQLKLRPNLGLWYEKFVDCWPSSFNRHPKAEERDQFLKWFCDHGENHDELLTAYWKRTEELVAARGGLLLEGTTASRLVSGVGATHPLETGFIWHRTLGVPYLPGSSLKGLLSAWARDSRGGYGMLGEERALELFGDLAKHGAGRLVILDVLPAGRWQLDMDIMNPHYAPYYQQGKPPADVWAPTPIKFLAVAKGVRFRFAVLPRTQQVNADDLKDAQILLEGALTTLGLGAKTACGYGLFKELKPVNVSVAQPAPGPGGAGAGPRAADSTGPGSAAGPGHSPGAPEPTGLSDPDQATALFQSLDQLPQAEKVAAAQRLQRYWQGNGSWDEWKKYKDKPKGRKKYDRVAKIQSILGPAGTDNSAGVDAAAGTSREAGAGE